MMKIAMIALMAFIATAEGEKVWTGLSAKWSANSSDGFFHLPETVDSAKLAEWTEIKVDGEKEDVTLLGYHGDTKLALIFSSITGKACGFQIAFLVSDIENGKVPINYTGNRAITERTLNDQKYFTARAYFYQNEKTNTRRVWLEEQTGLVEVPTNPDYLLNTTAFLPISNEISFIKSAFS